MRFHSGLRSACWPALAGTALTLACGHGGSVGGDTYGIPADAPQAVKAASAAGTAVDPAIVAANNGMAADLFGRLRQGAPAANLFISPLSLGMALGMAYNGAAGGTRADLGLGMHLGSLNGAQVNPDNAALIAALLTADPKSTFTIANSVWAKKTIYQAFLDTNANYYGAQIGTLDGAPATINAWVDARTRGQIPAILDPTTDCSSLEAILVNAIYFKGAWSSAFQAADTHALPFTRPDGTQVSCPTMNQTVTMGYRATAQARVGELAYGNGRFAMTFVLPGDGVTLDAVAATVAAGGWDALVGNLPQTSVRLALPKFKAAWSAKLNTPLEAMGMASAFDPNRADFSAMAPMGMFISFVIQKTTVEVDEAGTVASASTVIGMPTTVMPNPPILALDHPFLYAIRDTGTGELLFLGQLTDPTAH